MQNKFCLTIFVFCAAFCQGIYSYANPSDICTLNRDGGTGTDELKRFAYNSETGKCEEFIYGGLGGNRNNFQAQETCELACDGREICSLELITGPCRGGPYNVFGFDTTDGKCIEFIYGGCAGNGNRFSTEEKCQQICGKKTSPSLVVGLE